MQQQEQQSGKPVQTARQTNRNGKKGVVEIT